MSDEIPIEPQKENQLDPNIIEQSDIQTEEPISVEKVMDLLGADFELFYAKDGWNEVEAEGRATLPENLDKLRLLD